MYKYFYAGPIKVPSYGLILLAAFILCNIIALVMLRRENKDTHLFLVLELVASVTGAMGAKLLPGAGYSWYGGMAGFLTGHYIMWFGMFLMRIPKIILTNEINCRKVSTNCRS